MSVTLTVKVMFLFPTLAVPVKWALFPVKEREEKVLALTMRLAAAGSLKTKGPMILPLAFLVT